MYIHIYVYMYTNTYTFIQIYIYIYIYICIANDKIYLPSEIILKTSASEINFILIDL